MVHHRNQLVVISSQFLTPGLGIYSYDFTTENENALLRKFAIQRTGARYMGTLMGDGNADGQINNRDKNEI